MSSIDGTENSAIHTNLYTAGSSTLDESAKLSHTGSISSDKQLMSSGTLAKNARAAIIITDPNGIIEWVNPSFTEITGYSLAEAIGKSPGNLLQGPDTDPAVVAQMHSALTQISGFEVEVLNYHKNGFSYWLHLTVDPVFDNDGKLLNFIGVEIDVSQRLNYEQSLKLAVAQLTATLESTADGILVVDLDQKMRRYNQHFIEMWRIPQEIVDSGEDDQAIAFVLDQLELPDAFIAKIEQLYAAPEQESFDVLKLKDGRVLERYSRPQLVGGQATGRVWSFRDISERSQGERNRSALHRISEAAHTTQNLLDLFSRIHEIIGELMPANNFFVAMYDESIDELSFPYFIDQYDEAPSPRPLNSGTLSGEVIRGGKALLLTPSTLKNLREERRTFFGSDFIDWLGVPLVSHGKTIGALVVQSYSGLIRYSERDKVLLEFVSEQIAAAIERKQAENALRESEERHRLLADNAADVIWTLDTEGHRTYISPSVTKLRGFSVEEVLQQTLEEAFTPASAEQFFNHITALKNPNADQRARIELEQPCKDGTTVWVELTVTRMSNSEGQFIGYLGVSRDISERKLQASRIENLAFYDVLTQLPNRALFQDRLKQALAVAERHGQKVALLFLDLDRFKEINDSLGHSIGDQTLIEVSRRLQNVTRQEETLARLGGDEFVLITQCADNIAAMVIAERMLNTLVDPISITGNAFTVGGSIGIALYPDDGEKADELIKHTDIAMYRAKASGGGGYCFYQSDMGSALQKRIQLTARLTAALNAGELQLYYQPHFCLETGALKGAEALLRWHDSEYGWVSPAEFIPLAEERGMMGPLGDWVMTDACRQLNAWQAAGLYFPGRIAVNVSAKQLQDPQISNRLQNIVCNAGLTPDKFELELTESSMMADPIGAIAIMDDLSKAGFSLAIDDFGTGYSSLSYLKRFSVDRIKIDISFIRDMLKNKDDYAIVKAIIAMADSLGLQTTAEGVEQAEQATALTELGCNFVQGYHFGRPQSTELFADTWLHQSSKTVDTAD